MLLKKKDMSATPEKSLQEKMIEKEEAAATKERMAEELIEGKLNPFKNPLAAATAIVALTLSLLHIFYAYNGVIEAWTLRFTHVCLILLMCFLMKPTGRASVKDKPCLGTVWDIVCIVATLAVGIYIRRIKIQFSRCALRSWICDYNSNKIVQFIGQKFWYAA